MVSLTKDLNKGIAELKQTIEDLKDDMLKRLLRFGLGVFIRTLRKYENPGAIIESIMPINGQFTDDLLIYPPPYTLPGVQMFGFVFEGDTDKIDAYCDKKLNKIRGKRNFDYKPISNRILVTINYSPKILAGGNFRDYGWFSYNEITFWLPVMKWTKDGYWDNTPVFFIPLGFVDNPVAIAGGREVYGFPKQWGKIDMPILKDVNHDQIMQTDMNFKLDVLALKTRSAESEAKMQTLFEIKMKNPRPDQHFCEIDNTWEGERRTAEELKKAFATKDLDLDFNNFLPNIPILLLKEFRDVTNASGICYQSLIGMKGIFKQKKAARLTGSYEGVFNQLASHPIVELFGMATTQEAKLGFWVNMDMELGFGESLWQFPIRTAEQQLRIFTRLANTRKAAGVKKGNLYRTR